MRLHQLHNPAGHLATAKTLLIVISLGCFVEQAVAATPREHMPEALRSSIDNLAVVPGADPTERDIAGSYNDPKDDVYTGMASGATMGTPSVDVGPVTVSTSIPGLALPGAIAGGLFGHAKGELQDFRDALTRDLASETSQPLTNSRLALLVYQELQGLPGLESNLLAVTTPVAADTDAVLYVSINEVVIDVRDNEAILKTTAEISMLRESDGTKMHSKWFYYQDKDTLSNWTKNDYALWHEYAQFARHYLGREIAADVYARVAPLHDLRPLETKTMSLKRNNDWQGSSKSIAPELAWNLDLHSNDPQYAWVNKIGESDIQYDLEIYDNQRLIYAKERIAEPRHVVERALDKCETYRWSVRPSYRVEDSIKYGEWMRSPTEADSIAGKGHVGEKASEVPAYIQDFATVKINCRAR